MREIINISANLKENQFIIQKSVRTEFEDGNLIVSYEIGTRHPEEFYESLIIGEIYKLTIYKDPEATDGRIWFFRYNGKRANMIMSQSYIVPSENQENISYSSFRPVVMVNVDDIISIQPASESERKAYYFLETKYESIKSNQYSMFEKIHAENWKELVEIFNKM